VIKEEQEEHKDCLSVKLVVKRMLIEMLLLISLTGLWDIFPK
jgi:hypothetical protein